MANVNSKTAGYNPVNPTVSFPNGINTLLQNMCSDIVETINAINTGVVIQQVTTAQRAAIKTAGGVTGGRTVHDSDDGYNYYWNNVTSDWSQY